MADHSIRNKKLKKYINENKNNKLVSLDTNILFSNTPKQN